jgi:uncharacterized protein
MESLDELVTSIASVLADEPVAFAYVFGSVARGEARPGSDVDVAVHFQPGTEAHTRFTRSLSIGVELERALGRQVDVVDLEAAPLRLAGRILTERVVVVGLDRPERVRYESETFRRYVDFEHHARELDAAFLRAMAAGER